MAYNGSGTFSITTAGQPVVTGTVISSTAFNALTADLATGLSTAITKDGQTTTTARILFAQGVSSTLVTDATSATTGSIITAGGISMQKALWVGTTATIAGATTMAAATFSGNVDINKSVPVLSFTGTEGSAKKWSLIENAGVFYIQDTTTSVNLLSMTNTTLTVTGSLSVTSTSTLSGALTYGGVTLSNSVTGTGSMVLSTAPTLSNSLTINNSGGGFPGNIILTANYGNGSTQYIDATVPGGAVNLGFKTAGTERAVIDVYGKFGIGMTPTNVLDITQSQNNESRISILNSNGGASAAAELQATNGTHAGVLYQFGTGYTTSGILRQDGTVLSSGSSAGGLTLATFSSSPIYFGVGLAEVARFDTSGNLLSGTTTTGGFLGTGRVNAQATAGNVALTAYQPGSTGQASAFRVDNTTPNFAVFYYSTGVVGTIGTNGTATAYNTSSDARLKTNVSDAAPASALIDAIQVRQFDWKVDNSHQRYGMVAQELLEVAPEAVSVPTDPEQMMGVDYSKLVPMLIKEVQSLRTRLAALENK